MGLCKFYKFYKNTHVPLAPDLSKQKGACKRGLEKSCNYQNGHTDFCGGVTWEGNTSDPRK